MTYVSAIILRRCYGRRPICFAKGLLALATVVSSLPILSLRVSLAQDIASPTVARDDISGTWQGTLQSVNPARFILKFVKAPTSDQQPDEWDGTFYDIDSDMPAQGRRLNAIHLSGAILSFSVSSIDASFEGILNPTGPSLDGKWKEGNQTRALTFVKAGSDKSWAIPKHDESMAADATPRFEVATIKPTDPNHLKNGIRVRGRYFLLFNKTANQLISFSYGLQESQIQNEPSWCETDHYDIEGIPDLEGHPNLTQMQEMIRGLLSDRFDLRFHKARKNLPVYAITIARGGPKLTRSTNDPNGQPDQAGSSYGMRFTDMSMEDFAFAVQFIVNRPVVDETGIKGKFDFFLKWSQESSENVTVQAPPGFFTAVKEELGLTLKPKHSDVDVIVVDSMDRPSPN